MKISQIPQALETAHKANMSVFLKGAPGTAKTASVRQYAKSKGLHLVHIPAPLTDPLDVRGIPTTDAETARFLPLDFWPKETDKPVVVLIDEFPQCVPAIQNAYAQLLIDKQVGNIKLPEGSFVVATGNRKEDRAATHNIPSHIVSRVMHIEVDRSNDDFLHYALTKKFPIEIHSFGNFRPDAIYDFDAKNSQDPYACYRTWEYVANILKTSPPDDLLLELLSGVIGKGAATEFMAFRRMHKSLPDPKAVLRDPDSQTIPTEPSVLYAVSSALAAVVDDKNVSNYFKYIRRLPVEFAVMSVKTARTTYPEIKKAKDFGVWAKENSSVLF